MTDPNPWGRGRSHAIYGRVSTVGQGESLETQLSRLRRSAPGAVEFVDSGVSGRAADRPAFDRLREEIRSGGVESVTVTKLDRLGRSAKTILEFFNEAEENSARIIVIDQQVDTGTPVGRLVRTVLAAMAELEGDLIAERTREAMAAFKAGTRIPRAPVGRPRKVTVELAVRADVLKRQGLTWSQIAVRTGLKAETARRAVRILRRRVLVRPTEPIPEATPVDGVREDPGHGPTGSEGGAGWGINPGGNNPPPPGKRGSVSPTEPLHPPD